MPGDPTRADSLAGDRMNAAYFRTLFDYSAWARQRLLAAVEQLPEQENFATRPLDYGSIHGSLVHTFVPQGVLADLLAGRLAHSAAAGLYTPRLQKGGGSFMR